MYFNPNSIENQGRKLIQSSFICGISKENIKSKIKYYKFPLLSLIINNLHE